MKEKSLWTANLLLFLTLSLFLCAIQTSLWFQIFGTFPSPQLWLLPLIHISLFRSFKSFLPSVYIIAFAVSSASSMWPSTAMAASLAVGLGVRFFKKRIYWDTATYGMMVAGGATFSFHLCQWLIHSFLSSEPLAIPDGVSWITQSLITPLFSPLVLRLCRWTDQWTNQVESGELIGGGASS